MGDEQAREAAGRVPTGAELTALDPAFRTDPYPVLARLREREPVHHDDDFRHRRSASNGSRGSDSPS